MVDNPTAYGTVIESAIIVILKNHVRKIPDDNYFMFAALMLNKGQSPNAQLKAKD